MSDNQAVPDDDGVENEHEASKAKRAEEQKRKTVQQQHQHEGPETRNTENRGPTANNRGK